jgi:hypothetical protein
MWTHASLEDIISLGISVLISDNWGIVDSVVFKEDMSELEIEIISFQTHITGNDSE